MPRKTKQAIWTTALLKQGFGRFLQENGHYPSALEIDACPYLCISRQIQRKFGGLPKLRLSLGIENSNYSEGIHRKGIGVQVNKLATNSERDVGKMLRNRFGEICVHEEKRYGEGRNRVDFFVFAKENFAVEVFNTYTLHGVLGNLNPKLKRFGDFPYKLFFVITGAEFKQSQIDKIINRKKKLLLTQNMKCICMNEFENECLNRIEPLDKIND
ncbi:MAG: hypothetical protein JXA01_07550 [Dehalococcoidia bacterium]|nr:hypothetical protein [Dehalococcoidia bacterium]